MCKYVCTCYMYKYVCTFYTTDTVRIMVFKYIPTDMQRCYSARFRCTPKYSKYMGTHSIMLKIYDFIFLVFHCKV